RRHQRKTSVVPYGRRPTFENLERRTMLAVTLLNTPTWVERGPDPLTNTPGVDLNGDFRTDPGDVAVGAVEAIAVDPTDANHVFIGTTNGGIWETSNVNATTPVWTTTTDQLPSLSIGAIAFNPVKSNIIYAGTGSFSSARKGGSAVGVYR